MSRNDIEELIDSIERVIDRNDVEADPDDGVIWYKYGFTPDDVERYLKIGIADPHTAKAMQQLGARIGLIEKTREKVK